LMGHPFIENLSNISTARWFNAHTGGAMRPRYTCFHLRWSYDNVWSPIFFYCWAPLLMFAWISFIFSGVARIWTCFAPHSGDIVIVMLSLLMDCLFGLWLHFNNFGWFVFVGATFGGIETGGGGPNCSLGRCVFGGHGMCGVFGIQLIFVGCISITC
jgi:hypothetical protein